MRYESCRKCGVELQESKDEYYRCVACKEIIRLVCPKCNRQSDSQIHQHIYELTSIQTT